MEQLPSLTESEIIQVFGDFDTDNSGDISIQEFEQGVKRLKLPLSTSDIHAVLTLADTNGDGKICLSEFTQFVTNQEVKIRKAFIALDINQDHALCPSEIRKALRTQLNLEISSTELKQLMKNFSNKSSNNNAILFTEFRDKLLLLPAINTRYIYDAYKPTFEIDIGENFTVPSEQHDLLALPQYSKLNTFLAGGICGAISRTATAPADRIKVLFQSGALESGARIGDTISSIMNEGGVRSFWRGNGANVVKIAPESAVKFMSYEVLKYRICAYPDDPRMYERFLAGGLAGAAAQTSVYPLEIAKTRLALAASGEYSGIGGVLGAIMRKDGVRALYKGWLASVIGIVPYSGVDLAVYNTIKDTRARMRRSEFQYDMREPSAWEILLTGSFSSVCGQILAYPLQVMRTRLQSQGQTLCLTMKDGTVNTKTCPSYAGLMDCAKKTLVQDGVKGFYKGIMPNFMKSVPAISISYLVFEKTKPFLAQYV